MNSFTKEELEIISGSLYFTLLHRHTEITANIRKKINSMIDNYCEHEWINGVYCEKCNRSPTE